MAGVDAGIGVQEQLRLIAQLRWQLFRNGLRSIRGRLEVVSRVLTVLTMSGVVTAGAIGSAIAGYVALETHRSWLLPLVLWAVALVWQLYPIVGATSTVQFDFRNLLRFPLRFSSFVLLTLAYGLADPAAIATLLWLTCFTIGMLVASPVTAAAVLPVLVLFAAMNLLFGRMVLAWVDRWLAQRRSREILSVLFILLILAFQFSGPILGDWKGATPVSGAALLQWQEPLPPGVAAAALASAADGRWVGAVAFALAEVAYGGLFGGLLLVRLRMQYRGEDLGESNRARVDASPVAPGWRLPLLGEKTSAIVEKELRYVFRNPSMLVVFAVPVLLVCLLGLSHGSSRHGAGLVGQYGQFMYPVAAAYVSLVLLNIIYNSFGYDGNGIEWLYMAPVRFRQVLVGKNVTVVLLMTMNLVILWIAVGVVATPPGAMVVLPTIAAVAFLLLVHFSIGNLMSLQLPRRVSIGFSRNRVAGVSGLASLMVSAVSLAICAAAFGVGFWLGRMWIAAAVLAVFAVVVSPAYRWSLRRCDDLAMKQREVLVAELVRRE